MSIRRDLLLRSALLRLPESVRPGARLALVGRPGGPDRALAIVAQSDPIGTPNRWLNPVGVVPAAIFFAPASAFVGSISEGLPASCI